MEYTEVQMRRIDYLVKDRWVTDSDEKSQRNLDTALGEIELSKELHQFAANFNWDTGPSDLSKVLRHPLCDKGTALMIYFLGKPEWYYKRLQEGKPFIGDQPSQFAFLQEIESMVRDVAFPNAQIAFDPTKVRGTMNSLVRPGAELVPEYMKAAVVGEDVEILKIW